MAGIKVITPPVVEPVTLEEVKNQLRVDDDSLDDVLNPLITAAREWCEGYQNRAYVAQTLELALDQWPYGIEIELPRPPLCGVVSVVYTDQNGNSTTWDPINYTIDDYAFIAKIIKRSQWPTVTLPRANGIKVRYKAGYVPVVNGDKTDYRANVPQRVKQAILLLVTHWFENGMCDPPPAVYSLLNLDRVMPV